MSNTVDDAVRGILAHPKLVLPIDALVVSASSVGTANALTGARVVTIGNVRPDDVILDHGPGTSALLANLAREAETILWNGPLGICEDGFVDATNALAQSIASSHAYSVVGGGDTVAAIENLGLLSRFSFVSTGGGAMLNFLAKGTLPGIDALERIT